MSTMNRRRFCERILSAGAFCALPGALSAASLAMPQSSSPVYDLLIREGTVIDPSQNLNGRMDVAIAGGKIAEVAANIPPSQAREVVSAAGKIVCPGLIDIHAHVYADVTTQGLAPDTYYLPRGVTTVVDAGSAGYTTVAGLRKYIAAVSRTRVYALVDIGTLGLVAGIRNAMKNLDYVRPVETAEAVRANKPVTVGVKVRLTEAVAGTEDMEILRRTHQAAEGGGVPMMVHVGDTHSPLKDILGLMRPGDVMTHYLHPDHHGVLDANGKLLPEILDARQRGVLFDVGHGTSHFSFRVAEQCMAQGFPPDSISSDATTGTLNGPVFDTLTTLSKFLAIGMPLPEVLRAATAGPARTFAYGVQIGTFRKGSEADVSILEVRDGSYSFIDSRKETRSNKQKLFPDRAFRSGKM